MDRLTDNNTLSAKLPYLYGAIACVALYISYTVVQRLWLSPFRNVPGPLLAKLTSNWLLFIDLGGNRARTIHDLHQHYGPIVQIGPNELSFSGIEVVDQLYGFHSEYPKAPVYSSMARHGVFNMQDPAEHKQRRKLLNPVFTQSSVNEMEPHIQQQVQELLRAIDRHEGEAIDVRHWFRMLALDIAGDAFLGRSFGALDSDTAPQYVEDFDLAFIVWNVQGTFPMFSWILKQIPHPKIKHFFDTDDRIYQYGIDAFQDYIKRYGRVSPRKDLLTRMIGPGKGQNGTLTDEQISIEISNLLFAATDTAAITLTYLFWELAHRPELQARLRAELKGVSPASRNCMYNDIAKLPLLNAVIQETLRHYPATPSSLMRVTPAGGRALGGIFVPERTVVSVQAYTTHHDPTYFSDPYDFQPERWISTAGGTDEMKKLFFPFSRGTRNCIGQAMAMFEMKMTIASLVLRYNVSVNEHMKEEEMEMTDHFLIIPRGEKCVLDFALA